MSTNRPLQFSQEQLEIINANDKTLNVVAAAGAGKTRVLVQRYLRHVQKDLLSPDQILTITFTKKAAAEMKQRIVTSLREAELFDMAQIAETGPIQTIHSFCERLLRENSLEAGLDPNFEILGDSKTRQLALQSIREALANSDDLSTAAEGVISELAGKHTRGLRRSPYALLEDSIYTVLMQLRSSGKSREQIGIWHQNPSALRARWDEVITSAIKPKVIEELRRSPETDWIKQMKAAHKSVGEKIPAWLSPAFDDETNEEALYQSLGLVQLAIEAWWRFDQHQFELQALDFSELESRAVRLMERSEVTRNRIREQYKVLMIDEAQDVNPVQYQLLDRLGIDNQMRVGDRQQSIYGFRQADVKLFSQRIETEGARKLTKNYRSDEGILLFIDDLFGKIWSQDYQPMVPLPDSLDIEDEPIRPIEGVELWRHSAKDLDVPAQNIRRLISDGTSPKDICVLVRDGFAAGRYYDALEKAGIESRIAGGSDRFYTRLEVRDLANTLTALADPFDNFAMLCCLRSPMANLSLDAVFSLAKQEQPVIRALEKFISPVESDQPKLARFRTWFEPLSRYADRLSAWEVLSQVLSESDYLVQIATRPDAQQLLANVRKLLTLATQEPEMGPREYADQIREVQALQHKEGDAPAGAEDADVVTIMTIHKAKGLEYPVIVLGQTDKPLQPKTRDLLIESRQGLIATKYSKGQSIYHRFLAETAKDRGVEEELRVLYVALTRAERKLCISIDPESSKDTFSRRINNALGKNLPPGIIVRDSLKPKTTSQED